MALWNGRKSDKQDDAGSVAVMDHDAGDDGGKAAKNSRAEKPKKVRPDDLLSSVIKESTPGAAVALMRENAPFLVDQHTAAILLLDVTDIGGLSRRQKRDETKGTLIELIQADHITTLATAGMLAENVFGIIPTAETLSRMDEFNLLVDAPYKWGAVDLNTFAIVEGGPASFSDAKQVSAETLGLDSVFNADTAILAEDHGANPVRENPMAGGEDLEDPGTVDWDASIDDLGEVPQENGTDVFMDAEDVLDEVDYEALDHDDYADGDDQDEYGDEGSDDPADGPGNPGDTAHSGQNLSSRESALAMEVVPKDQRVVTEAEVRDTIARRFLDNGLGLQVDLAPFEAFVGDEEPALFDEQADKDDWLGQQLAQMAKQANVDLMATRQRHTAAMREQFVALMGAHAEKIISNLDIDNPSTTYGALKAHALQEHAKRAMETEEVVAKRRKQLLESFDQELEARAAAAAEQARLQYKDRHEPRLSRQIGDITSSVVAQSDDILANQQQQVLVMRKAEAGRRMDLGVNSVLGVLGTKHAELMDREAKLYQEHMQRMQDFLDEHRKEDVARTEVLAEQLARNDQSAKLTEEYEGRMNLLRQQHAAEVERLQTEIEAARGVAGQQLRESEQRWQSMIDDARARADQAQQRFADFDAEQSRVRTEYTQRVVDLNSDKDRLMAENERTMRAQDRGMKVLTLRAFVMAFVALGIGLILGASLLGS